MVIALLGVWTSVAVVWFELVDYEEVLGKLGVYDADGDGDFDVDDAKVLLGLKERSASKPAVPPEEAEPYPWLEELVPEGTGPQHIEDEVQEEIHSPLHETAYTEHGEDLQQEAGRPAGEQQPEDDFLVGGDADDTFEPLEAGTFPEETEHSHHVEETASQIYKQDMEEMMYEQKNPESIEPVIDDERLYHDEMRDDITYQDYDQQAYEPLENEGIETSDNAVEDSHITLDEVRVPPAEEQQEIPPDT